MIFVQYLFAADRDNKRVADALSILCPWPMLRALKRIVDKARANNMPLSLCGEMGGQPLEAMALLAFGFRDLSMSPASDRPGEGDGACDRFGGRAKTF